MTTVRALATAILMAAMFGAAVAKLPPAPPLTEEQKAQKAAKDKAATEATKAQLMRAEDRAVANYIANQKAKGVPVKAQMPAGSEPAAGHDSGGGKAMPAQPEKASNAHSPPKK